MIEINIISWAKFLLLVGLSTMAGINMARWVPWSNAGKFMHFKNAAGMILAPFITGMISIFILMVFPGASNVFYEKLIFTILVFLAFFYFIKDSVDQLNLDVKITPSFGGWLLPFFFLIWVLMLLVNAVFIPLTQNDALEYAIVGRELFINRSLYIYPLTNPEISQSGFFGPWTHPPLYVSLIYLVSILQGHADEPGLMRLISPWFILSAAYGVFVLGRLRSPNVGWLSAILFMSTPLLFLGADSALIDALPVSGMVILMLMLVGVQYQRRAYPMALGVVLGLTLWTHSQAILFIPLVVIALCIQQGVLHWRRAVVIVCITLASALIVGSLPYVRNYFLFGSLISDTPHVFAMPELDWEGYFSYSRGLDHGTAVLQYGILKGWFSLEAFGVLFWLWAAGSVIFMRQQGMKRLVSVALRGLCEEKDRNLAMWQGFVLIATYLAGVVVSAAMGIDLMIRNERYMLVIVPMLAIGGGYFLEVLLSSMWKRIQSSATGRHVREAMLIGYSFIAVAFLLQALIVGWYYRWNRIPSIPKSSVFTEELTLEQGRDQSRFDWILGHWPSVNVAKEISKIISEDSLVLAMRPADMYYAKRKMVSYLDPTLMPFYREKDPATAVDILKSLGINYVFMTDYSLPPAYNSSLLSILADPRLSRLVYSAGMSQLYELDSSHQSATKPINMAPGQFPWTRSLKMRIGGRKALDTLGFKPSIFGINSSASTMPFFHRDYSVVLASGLAAGLGSGRFSTFVQVDTSEYVVRMNVVGQGYVIVWLSQFDSIGNLIKNKKIDRDEALRLGDFSLSEVNPSIEFARRFRIEPETHYIRIGVEHVGRSDITIKKMTLERLVPDDESGFRSVDSH
jgi:hypothetical protein